MKLSNLSIIFLFLLCSCSQLDRFCGYTKITQDEYAILENVAREFALMHEKSLNELDKKIIKENTPRFDVYYTGFKFGQFSFVWSLSEGRVLSVYGYGSLIDKNSIKGTKIRLISGIEKKQ